MHIPTSVAADLALLSDVLDSPSAHIEDALSALHAELARSVPSFVALSVSVETPDARFDVTTLDDVAQSRRIGTSLEISLLGGTQPGHRETATGVLVVYAARPGALVDLAADLTWLLGRPLSDARLDHHLDAPPPLSRDSSLSRASLVNQALVNQALGFLIEHGRMPEQARDELDALAASSEIPPHSAAAEILRRTRRRPERSDDEGS